MEVRIFVCFVYPLFLKPKVELGTWEKKRKERKAGRRGKREREGRREKFELYVVIN